MNLTRAVERTAVLDLGKAQDDPAGRDAAGKLKLGRSARDEADITSDQSRRRLRPTRRMLQSRAALGARRLGEATSWNQAFQPCHLDRLAVNTSTLRIQLRTLTMANKIRVKNPVVE